MPLYRNHKHAKRCRSHHFAKSGNKFVTHILHAVWAQFKRTLKIAAATVFTPTGQQACGDEQTDTPEDLLQ